MKVTWRSIAPIFADVVVSPWNLLVGGILIQHLSFLQAVCAIMTGYGILGAVFILYGGLGFKKRKQSAALLSEVFGSKIVKYIIPLILAIGQIGWAAINIDLGGKSFSTLFSLPFVVGISLYALILVCMAMLNLSRMGVVKLFISLSALALMIILLISKLHTTELGQIISYHPDTQNSFFWGVSIVVASLISFATVTPDFFQSVMTKKDVVYSTVGGLVPGIFVASLGCLLFYGRHSLDLLSLLQITPFFLLPNIFNAITNTDGSTALFTPALKLQSIFPINFQVGVVIAGVSSFVLALTQLSLHLILWLDILSLLFPAFIGVCFTAFLFNQLARRKFFHKEVIASFAFSLVIAVIAVSFFPPVLLSLVAPLFFFAFSTGYTNLSIL